MRYVVNFDSANELLIKLTADPIVAEAVRKCHAQVERRTKSWDLAGFLIKPVQRVLKYPLLMKELIKRTADDHPDYARLQEAERLLVDVATAINEGRRTKELVGKCVTADFVSPQK